MPSNPAVLLNTTLVEVWPGGLLRARGNTDARMLAGAGHVFRRKRDGRYLAIERDGVLLPLRPGFRREPGLDEAMTLAARARQHRRSGMDTVPTLPLDRLHERLDALGLDAAGYRASTGLALVPEPEWLALAGFDRYERPTWLHPAAARSWQQLQEAARREGVVLEAISGYRSHDYQLGIFERKLAHGQTVEEILTVNAAPGFSEHHGGRALDVGTPGEPPAEESFEATPAFAWLQRHAAAFGFQLSYPRGNPHGITYEPWHWAHSAD